MADKPRVYDVFYRDYRHQVAISSANPEPLDAKRLAPLAERLLEHADNFFGVVDREHTILQLYLDDAADAAQPQVIAELLFAENPGYYQARMPLAEALQLLRALPELFDSDLLPGGRFIG